MEEDEEAYYIVEEYVEGDSLEALMLQSSLITPDFICHTIAEIAEILDYIHRLKPNPVIYQDLKAEHVIIGKSGIKLIDFGIASYLGEVGNQNQNYGTPRFCAPEKLSEAKVSIQTDIYSVGKLLEELIYAEGNNQSRHLMYIAKKASSADLSERYATIREFMADLNAHMQSEKKSVYQKHLLKKIVAAGSQPRIGTTHLSISLTEYLNQQNIDAVYQEKNSSEHMRKIIRQGGFTKEGGLYRRGNFLGMPAYGEGVFVHPPEGFVRILDCGSKMEQFLSEEADLFLFIIGSSEWERESADFAYEKVKNKKNLAVIVNYGGKDQAKQYAKKYGRTVYCFPLDENPFLMTKEKERLFEGLLEKGGTNQTHWNCRKHSGQWSNALIRGIGKLCGRRSR